MAASLLLHEAATSITNKPAAIDIAKRKTSNSSTILQQNNNLFKSNSYTDSSVIDFSNKQQQQHSSKTQATTCSEWLAKIKEEASRTVTAETPPPEYFFEGTEKLLEIWFADKGILSSIAKVGLDNNNSNNNIEQHTGQSPSPPLLREEFGDGGATTHAISSDSENEEQQQQQRLSSSVDVDLRLISDETWQEILDVANCKILSKISNGIVDAYLLSESSMFVSKRRLVLKTCGTTTPILAVEKILSVVQERFGRVQVDDMYYSRKNFARPHLQLEVHKSFKREVQLLERYFPGAAYCMGRLNADCWFLYTMHPMEGIKVSVPDQTLEVIMTDLVDDNILDIFRRPTSRDGHEASVKSGITTLIEGVILDDFLFDPCGYSSNALLPKSEYYYDIHITPEKDFNYVSFETNVPQARYQHLVARLLRMFKPGKMLMTVFANHGSVAKSTPMELQSFLVNGYSRLDYQYCQLKNYDLSVVTFVRCPTTPTIMPRNISMQQQLLQHATSPVAEVKHAVSALDNNKNFGEQDNDDAGFADDGGMSLLMSAGGLRGDDDDEGTVLRQLGDSGFGDALGGTATNKVLLAAACGDGGRANTINAAVAFGDTADAEKQQNAAAQELDRRAAPERIR